MLLRFTVLAGIFAGLFALPGAGAADPEFAATLRPDAGNNLILRWPGQAGKRYRIEHSSDMSTWAPWPGEFACAANRELDSMVVPGFGNAPQRQFWRVVGTNVNSVGACDSVEMGHGPLWYDLCERNDAPAGGSLFSVWTRLPVGWTNWWHNMEVFSLKGSNWSMSYIVANISFVEGAQAMYNANTMLGVNFECGGRTYDPYDADYSWYYRWGQTARQTEWVWVAWQTVVTGDSIRVRQWLKFGVDGAVIPAWDADANNDTSEVNLAKLRERFRTNYPADMPDSQHAEWEHSVAAWVPSDAVSFQVGAHSAGVYLTHARLEARSTEPTLAELEAISRRTSPDPTAWADYELNWKDGAANLTDRSGHNRHLQPVPGGTFYRGSAFPGFAQ
jgi:hypothetical protein